MEDEGDRNDIVGLPMLLPDNNLWKTLHDSHGNPIMGLLYPRSDYSNISIAEVSSLFPRQNFFSSWIRVIECKDNEFAFQSAWKCMICMRQMNVCLKFIDHKTSYIFDKNKGERCFERLLLSVTNTDLSLGHRNCLEDETTSEHNFFFFIQELRMPFLKWWEMWIMFISRIMIIFGMGCVLTVFVYKITYNWGKFLNNLLTLLMRISICVKIYQLIVQIRRRIYLNGYNGSRMAMRLGLRIQE